ncbi:MAG: hypothetical protein FD171_945 [Actinobacteria bacterium]|nr:MAG: hypothetical protein FD171_945 [Actinomycetota bacterium]
MNERPPEPTSASEWARIARRRRILVWSGIGLAVLLAIGIIVALVIRAGSDTSSSATFQPVDRGDESSVTAGSSSETDSVGSTSTPGGSSSSTGAAPSDTAPGAQGPCLIAYRRAGSVYVANADGSGERRVAASAEGVFSVAPDGRTLALIDVGSGTLALFDVATGKRIAVGPANQETPSWPSASAWVVYSSGSGTSARVRRVDRDGRNPKVLFDGAEAAASADGAVVCGIAHDASGSSVVKLYRSGKAVSLPISGYVTDVACSGARVFYSLAGDDGAESSIHSMTLSGGENRSIRVGPQAGARASFQDLLLTSVGTMIAFTETGDDGYSRLFVMGVDGGGERSLSVRRDDYPLGWGCDGRLYFMEGNAIQGEATKLMAVAADGTGRVVVVEGAGR